MGHQLIPFPVKEHDLALYLQHVAEATKSKAAVYSMTEATKSKKQFTP